jgi:multiple sugar transport system substrate-binding protein
VTPEYESAVGDLVKKFESEHPGIKVKVNTCGWQPYQSKVLTLSASHMCPDVILSCVEAGFYSAFRDRGLIMDLDEFVNKDKSYNINDFFPAGLKAFQDGGKLYGIPLDMNPEVMYYNRTMFREAGIPYPDGTWDLNKLLEVSKKLTKDTNGDGRTDQYGFVHENFLYCLRRAHVSLFSSDHKTVLLNTPEAEKVVKYLVDMRLKYGVTPPSSFFSRGTSYELFAGKRIALMEGIPAYCSYLRKCKDLDWDIAPVVQMTGKRFVELPITGYSISSETKHPKEAWEFVKFMTSPDSLKYICKKAGNVPARESVCKDKTVFGPPPANIGLIIDSLKYAESFPYFVRYNEVQEAMYRQWDKMYLNLEGVGTGLTNIEADGNKILRKK